MTSREDTEHLASNNMWVRLDVDPDNLDPEYRPEITTSENWPGEPFSLMTIGWDEDADVAVSTLSCSREINALVLLVSLLEIVEYHALHSAGMEEGSFFPSALSGARMYLENLYAREAEGDEDDDE